MLPFSDRYIFALATEEQICDALHDIRKSALISNDDDEEDAYDELEIAEEIIRQIENAIAANPQLMSDQVLGAFIALALDSPHRDINEDKTSVPHKKSPEQELALLAVRSLGSFKFCLNVNSEALISKLETIAMNALDRDIRREAIGQIYNNASAGWNAKAPPVVALHRIACDNTDLFTRIEARNKLMSLGQGQIAAKSNVTYSPKP